MFKCFSFRECVGEHANYLKNAQRRATLDDPYMGLAWWSLLQAIRGQFRCFAFNFW